MILLQDSSCALFVCYGVCYGGEVSRACISGHVLYEAQTMFSLLWWLALALQAALAWYLIFFIAHLGLYQC